VRGSLESVLRAAVIVAVGAAAGFTLNAVRGSKVALTTFEAPVACSAPHATEVVLTELEPMEASSYCGRKGVIFADARGAEAFAAGHVAEAIHLPCDASGSSMSRAENDLDQAERVVVYADTTEGARPVADGLRRRHPKVDVRVLRGGFPAWEAHGLQCAAGPCPDCTATHP
jgi:rhodanese-related sulfurtransferase